MLTNYIHMLTKVAKKVACFFHCEKCDYNTSRKSSYVKHLSTVKHSVNTSLTKSCEKLLNVTKNETFICPSCYKIYKSRVGLYLHKQKCIQNNEDDSNPKMMIMFMEMVKQNNDFKELLVDQNKQLIELSSKSVVNNTTNNNNSFNLQFFLNETCKDALNISDFVKQLQVGVKDLEETGRIGYAEGISKIFINGLKQLDINLRPVHCSDFKRETIYIKDSNQWSKETDENAVLTNAIKDVAHKNIQQIPIWTEEHPEHKDLSSKYNDKYMKLVSEAMPGSTKEESDKNYKKVVRNIMKESIIDK